jgi:anti-sigma factor RsiW
MNVNCRSARLHLEDPAKGCLDAVKAHLAACPDCASTLERTRRLQSLLSLKRHERPDEFVERNFLPEFHRRLYANIVRRRTFLSRVRAFLEFDGGIPATVRALTLASALALSLLSLYTVHTSMITGAGTQSVVAQHRALQAPVENEVAFSPRGAKNPTVYVLDRVSYAPRLDETAVLSF